METEENSNAGEGRLGKYTCLLVSFLKCTEVYRYLDSPWRGEKQPKDRTKRIRRLTSNEVKGCGCRFALIPFWRWLTLTIWKLTGGSTVPIAGTSYRWFLFGQEIVKHQHLLHGDLPALLCGHDSIDLQPALEVALFRDVDWKASFFFFLIDVGRRRHNLNIWTPMVPISMDKAFFA